MSSTLDFDWPSNFARIPKAVFQREDIFAEELSRIFYGPEWHPLCHTAEIPHPGDFKTIRLGQLPVIIAHGHDGQIRVFYNSCTHRGTELQTCALGNAKTFECPYHRWTYSTDGKLIGAPGMDGFQDGFRKEDYGLVELRTAEFLGLIFATCSNETPALEEYLGETIPTLEKILAGAPLRLLGYQKVIFDTNWKEWGDNDHYHPPLLHSAFRLLKWQGANGRSIMTAYGHMFNEVDLKIPERSFLNDPTLLDVLGGEPARSLIVGLFPVFSAFRHLNVINVRYAIPHSAHRTEAHYAYFAPAADDETLLRHRLRQSANLIGPSGFITLEDGAVFNRLHRGSLTPGVAEFQKGVRGPISGPIAVNSHEEACNLVKWERYREIMGFRRVAPPSSCEAPSR